ncbi:N-acetyltransferase family protein [Rhodoferax sp.]|uniref:GNAT family N-acetyltransferase n=1 Tax=Rhodoferax sp. TaxID=50421 RepID=UPI002841A84D|nr:N-acetyltransferase family protein [Rhodoferax sp.]MDR3370599.1 GNAT family N-acetyltransferase [Rhodoferax sp.]
MLIIRPSHPRDINQITAIYAHHVKHGTGSFEVEPPSETDMALRRDDVISKGLPYLVATDGTQILGYAYCNWFKPRPAYRFSAEDSIYLAPEASGTGLGRALLAELMRQAECAGVRKMIAVIGDSGNQGSIGVHRSAGFAHVGTLTACGRKFDRWLDVVLMDRTLGLGDTAAPK